MGTPKLLNTGRMSSAILGGPLPAPLRQPSRAPRRRRRGSRTCARMSAYARRSKTPPARIPSFGAEVRCRPPAAARGRRGLNRPSCRGMRVVPAARAATAAQPPSRSATPPGALTLRLARNYGA